MATKTGLRGTQSAIVKSNAAQGKKNARSVRVRDVDAHVERLKEDGGKWPLVVGARVASPELVGLGIVVEIDHDADKLTVRCIGNGRRVIALSKAVTVQPHGTEHLAGETSQAIAQEPSEATSKPRKAAPKPAEADEKAVCGPLPLVAGAWITAPHFAGHAKVYTISGEGRYRKARCIDVRGYHHVVHVAYLRVVRVVDVEPALVTEKIEALPPVVTVVEVPQIAGLLPAGKPKHIRKALPETPEVIHLFGNEFHRNNISVTEMSIPAMGPHMPACKQTFVRSLWFDFVVEQKLIGGVWRVTKFRWTRKEPYAWCLHPPVLTGGAALRKYNHHPAPMIIERGGYGTSKADYVLEMLRPTGKVM